MTVEAKPALTMTVPEAGAKYFGLSRNAAYEAAKRGDMPVIRIGRLLRVPVRALERMLDQAGHAARLPLSSSIEEPRYKL
jgi:excisionase family DNA binding protein